jgi:ERCC4-type nuclease
MTHKQCQIEIVVDERENTLYDKCSEILSKIPVSENPPIRLSKCVLHLGDIVFKLYTVCDDPAPREILLFERKSLTDLLASIKDGRYKEQSHRLINATPLLAHNIVYVIEGIYTTLKNPADKSKIISCMTSLGFFKGFSVLKTASLNETAEYLMSMAGKMVRDLREGKPLPAINKPCRTTGVGGEGESSEEAGAAAVGVIQEISSADYCGVVKAVKKENVLRENIGEIVLCQIPGISSVTAKAIMAEFTSFSEFYGKLRENPEWLDSLVIIQGNGKGRKISRTSAQKIREYLL